MRNIYHSYWPLVFRLLHNMLLLPSTEAPHLSSEKNIDVIYHWFWVGVSQLEDTRPSSLKSQSMVPLTTPFCLWNPRLLLKLGDILLEVSWIVMKSYQYLFRSNKRDDVHDAKLVGWTNYRGGLSHQMNWVLYNYTFQNARLRTVWRCGETSAIWCSSRKFIHPLFNINVATKFK